MRSAALFQNGSIGDFLMAVTLARRLHASGILSATIIVPRGASFLAGFIAAYPFIRVIELNTKHPGTLLNLAPLVRPHTLVVLPPTVGKIPRRSKLLAWLMTRLPGSVLVGFQDAGPFNSFYTHTLPYDTDQPFAATITQVLSALGLPAHDGIFDLDLAEDPSILADNNLAPQGYVLFHARGSSEKRSFAHEDAIAVVDVPLSADPALQVALTGSKDDHAWISAVRERSADPQRVALISGASPAKLAAIVRNAAFVVSVDTGITHLACFLGARVIVIAHKGTANWLPYYHENARILYRLEEDDRANEDPAYLAERRAGRVKPFGNVPNDQVISVILEELSP